MPEEQDLIAVQSDDKIVPATPSTSTTTPGMSMKLLLNTILLYRSLGIATYFAFLGVLTDLICKNFSTFFCKHLAIFLRLSQLIIIIFFAFRLFRSENIFHTKFNFNYVHTFDGEHSTQFIGDIPIQFDS